jgi:hypothetical protein
MGDVPLRAWGKAVMRYRGERPRYGDPRPAGGFRLLTGPLREPLYALPRAAIASDTVLQPTN